MYIGYITAKDQVTFLNVRLLCVHKRTAYSAHIQT